MARRADDLAERLLDITERSTLNGIRADHGILLELADPASLFDDDGLPDPAAIVAALIATKPYLALQPRGNIDQGLAGARTATSIDLAGTLRKLTG